MGVETICPERVGWVAVFEAVEAAVEETEDAADAVAGVGVGFAPAAAVDVDVALVADDAGGFGTARGCDIGVSYRICDHHQYAILCLSGSGNSQRT